MPANRGRHRLMAEINVVPYIDVMLVLLVIFMITAPLLSTGVKVDLPQAAAEPLDRREAEPLVVAVDQARCRSRGSTSCWRGRWVCRRWWCS